MIFNTYLTSIIHLAAHAGVKLIDARRDALDLSARLSCEVHLHHNATLIICRCGILVATSTPGL
jgi:hypothetical protein